MSNHLRRLEINRYRGFENLVLEDLGDINIIVGKNNVGKTALVESLVLLGMPCHIDTSLAVNEVRGLKGIASDTEESYGLHFYNRNFDSAVTIRGTGDESDIRELKMQIGQGTDLYPERHSLPNSGLDPTKSSLLQQKVLRFDYTRVGSPPAWSLVTIANGQKIAIDSTTLPEWNVIPHTSNSRLTTGAENLFSSIMQHRTQGDLLPAINTIAPEISELLILTRAGEPVLFAGTHDGRLLPLQLFGDGVARLTSWMLSLLLAKDAILAIDEIENGLHHSVMEKVWAVLMQTAKRHNVQLFATTHSYEVLVAMNSARKALNKEAPSVRAIRLQKIDNQIVPVVYNEGVLDAAIESEIEVR